VTLPPGSVLALRALGLGDALTGIPALRGLRRAFPDRRLVLAAPEALGSWLCRLGVVDAVLPTTGLQPLSATGEGIVAVNLHGRGPQSHRLLRQLRPERLLAFACPEAGHSAGPDWRADEHEVARWCRLVHSIGGPCGPQDLRLRPANDRGPGPAVVHPGAASAARRWPPDRWTAVLRALLADGHQVVLTGGAEEAALCAALAEADPRITDTAGRLDLDALTTLVGSAALVLCGDTGLAHLATACGTPSVLLFGPTAPRLWGPAVDEALHAVLWHGDPAADSWGDPHGSVTDPRLTVITPGEVLDAAHRLLTAH